MPVPRFWREQKGRYNLIGTYCKKCGKHFYPARSICPFCRRSGEIEDFQFKGKGEIVTYSVIHASSEDFDHLTPYILAIVKLDEGPCITTQIVDEPTDIKIGDRVKAVFRRLGSDGKAGDRKSVV